MNSSQFPCVLTRKNLPSSTLLACIAVVSFAGWCWGQANVNENLETANIYVDAKNGSDNNNGSKNAPLKTIGAAATIALANNHSGVGTRVTINPGTYREFVQVGGGGNRTTNAPITFQAATNGTVFVSGADVMTGWTTYSGNSKIFENNWPYNFGKCAPAGGNAPVEQEIVLRREILAVNGTPFTQVLSLASMLPGTFFVDDQHAKVYVYPAPGLNLSNATVEVATRPRVLQDDGQPYVVFRGLTFEYANTCHGDVAVEIDANATNVMFDSDSFLWNNAMGMAFNMAKDFTVKNSVANHNGEMGFHSYQVKNDLWQSDVANHNNWRGAQGAFYTWDTGGAKWMLDHAGTYNNVTAAFNIANAVAFDTDQENVALNGLVASSNVGNGLQIEKSEGPVSLASSYLCANNLLSVNYKGGVVVRNSEGVNISGTTLYGNGANQVAIVGQAGGIQITNWETGQGYNLISKNLTSTGNTMDSGANVFSDGYLGGSDWNTFVSSLNSNKNTHYAGASGTGAFAIPTPRAGTIVDFTSWKSTTGQDSSSSWQSANVPPACTVKADAPDFWITTAAIPGVNMDATGTATVPLNAFSVGGLTGNINLSADGISSVAGLSAKFTPSSISTTGSAVLQVAVAPGTAPGTYPVTILANQGNVTHTVAVSVGVLASSVRLSAINLTFAGQKVATTSAGQIITLTNVGRGSLGMSRISTNGNFSQTNTCGSSVRAGGNCTITVTFTPRVVGLDTGRLTIEDGDGSSPQLVALSGTGTAAAKVRFSPLSLYFGGQRVGTNSHKTLAVTNSGTSTLTISKMSLGGANSGDFKFTSTCGASLAAKASCTVAMTFTPPAKGARAGTFSIYDNDGYEASPQTVTLIGTGR
jgi:hypothetical protein